MLANILAIFGLVHCASALYFHMSETERKCFIEELPDQTMVTGKVKTHHAETILGNRKCENLTLEY